MDRLEVRRCSLDVDPDVADARRQVVADEDEVAAVRAGGPQLAIADAAGRRVGLAGMRDRPGIAEGRRTVAERRCAAG
ncbi:MAG: hypothetical protein HY060_23855 [Proteobacteria bacterium]|nr:hypothetical protein [Pseudomonadota bacterium]